jgi:hypothetical protein
VVGTNFAGQIYTSIDSGATWTARATSHLWDGIASSSDGTKLAAVVNGGQIYTSTDSGVTWTARATSQGWIGIASSSDGTKLVASCGQIYTSIDSGVTWTARSSGLVYISYPTSSWDGTKLTDGSYSSTDSGVTWTACSGRAFRRVASSSDGIKLAAIPYNGQIWIGSNNLFSVGWPGTTATYQYVNGRWIRMTLAQVP